MRTSSSLFSNRGHTERILEPGASIHGIPPLTTSHLLSKPRILSAYYASNQYGSYYLRPRKAILAIWSRIGLSLGLALQSALFLLLREKLTERPDGSSLLESCVKILFWTTHAHYNYNLLHRLSLSPRGPNRVLALWVLCLIPDLIPARSNLLQTPSPRIPTNRKDLLFYEALFQNVCLTSYALTLFFGPSTSTHAWTGHVTSYGGFVEEYDYNYLGVAQEDASILDRLFFKWGRMGKLRVSEDVFDLPHEIHTGIVYEDFEFHKSRTRSLLWFKAALSSKFLYEFLGIGGFKFLADLTGFISPLLLNRLSDRGHMQLPVQFRMNELGLKVRAAVIQSVYKQTLSVSEANLNQFSRGEVINFMSVDVDRVVNFAPSLHAFWSLPFQMVVTLYLLHTQVGPSAFVGVALALLMIPINNNNMMSAKDRRVKIIAEIIEASGSSNITAGRMEIYYLKWRKYLDAICVYLWASTPVIISVSTFATYSALGHTLTASKVFTSMALFAMLSGPFNSFPFVINGLIEANVSIRRLAGFLSLPNIQRLNYFSDESNEETELDPKIPDISIKEASFGFDKNSFSLRNIDLEKQSGKISVRDPISGIAYVQQIPGFKTRAYGKTSYLLLHRGDLTMAGERGARLSGGQKARIALARAIYQDKDIYLIDDVFASLDPNVGARIYNEVMLDLLKKKTRILCTHNPQYVNDANVIIRVKDGEFESVLKTSHLVATSPLLASPEINVSSSSFDFNKSPTTRAASPQQPIEEYWQAIGTYLSPIILGSIFVMQLASNTTDLWLSHWVTSENYKNNTQDAQHYIYIYTGLAVFHSIATLFRAFVFAYGGIKAAQVIHELLLGVLLRAKIYFFDSTPAGRILNRFSSDTYAVDDSLPFILNIFLAQVFGVFGRLFVCIYAVPWIYHRAAPCSTILRNSDEISSGIPIYEHFNETVHGLKVIRASKASQRFLLENEELVNAIKRPAMRHFVRHSGWKFDCNYWLRRRSLDAGLVGLAVSYALGMTSRLSEVVVTFTETERELVAVERSYDYIDRIYEEAIPG
ncbi:ATP-binding cassette sub-family C member 7, partial [Caligus rogercresseyi]